MRVFYSTLLVFLTNLTFSQVKENSMFKEVLSSRTNINFSNDLHLNLKVMANFDYSYAGGGVAVGDINNDGLVDVYIVGNSVEDKLYLNKGNFVFEDITIKAITSGFDGWHTGANMIDVNADGYLDIFVSRISKDLSGKTNLLYINNQDNTFTEQADNFGFVDMSITFQTVFFDVDQDGDLDCYVLNNINRAIQQNSFLNRTRQKQSDIFYENRSGHFINMSQQVGIDNDSFGLGIVASDINNDGEVDVYVSNDFEGRDFLFINKDGSFNEEIQKQTKHISYYGMGVDIADINNDGLVEIMVLDMGYDDHIKSKENMPSMSIERFWKNVYGGNHYQYMQNTLQLNNGNGSFSEIAQLAGISKTDWSWGVLLADFDNDGFKDIVITNGIQREIMNQDFTFIDTNSIDLDTNFYKTLPLSKSQNRIYKNNQDLTFSNMSEEWGFDYKINSSGIAYADFDNDGDLDLIINNLDTICSVFENKNIEKNNFMSIQLVGNSINPFVVGAKVELYTKSGMQMKELFPVRGFQSSVDYRLLFGLNKEEIIEKIVIRWPDLRTTVLKNVQVNQFLVIEYNKSKFSNLKPIKRKETLFTDYTKQLNISYEHNENKYNDFERELLLPHMYSRLGPTISVGDINGDGLEDFFVGSPKNQKSVLYVQNTNGSFSVKGVSDIENDFMHEDVGSLFFDFDNDNDLDLYVTSGGNDNNKEDTLFQDRLYINDGNANFTKSTSILPIMLTSTKVVEVVDFDNDGDLDLFVGGRVVPGYFPESPQSYLLENKNGKFIDVTSKLASELKEVGMVTAASFEDVNGDDLVDIVVVGEWMPLTVFVNNGNGFDLQSPQFETEGLWYSLKSCDIDNDGDMDFIAGNLGSNTKYKASLDKPFHVYGNDFDNNGTYDIVLSTYQDTINYPVRGKECSSQQMPFINTQFQTYHDYAKATMEDIYGDKLNQSKHLTVRTLKSCVFVNDGAGNFSMKILPNRVQFSPILSIETGDFNKDGNMDALLVGNLYETEVETVRYDAGIGVCLLGDGMGNFSVVKYPESGICFNENTKTVKQIQINGQSVYLFGVNNRKLSAFILR